MEMREHWDIDAGIKERYINACKRLIDDEAFKNFRQDEEYGMILEGRSDEIANIAIEYLRQYGGEAWAIENIDKFRDNDRVGSPRIMGNSLSPATWRYVNAVWQVKMLLGDFKPRRIIEIGGGYGGMCRALSVVYDFEEYTNIDLPEAQAIFNKYISHYPVKTNNVISGNYDLFIADSSLSECDKETQLKYIQIAKQCPYIYLVYNTIHKGREAYDAIMEELKDYNQRAIEWIWVDGKQQRYTFTLLLNK